MYLLAGVTALTAAFAYKHKMLDLAPVAECATAFQDKNLIQVMEKVDAGLEKLYKQYPEMAQVKVSHGLRGIRYFVEFPIVGKNIDAFSLLTATQ